MNWEKERERVCVFSVSLCASVFMHVFTCKLSSLTLCVCMCVYVCSKCWLKQLVVLTSVSVFLTVEQTPSHSFFLSPSISSISTLCPGQNPINASTHTHARSLSLSVPATVVSNTHSTQQHISHISASAPPKPHPGGPPQKKTVIQVDVTLLTQSQTLPHPSEWSRPLWIVDCHNHRSDVDTYVLKVSPPPQGFWVEPTAEEQDN